MQKLYIWTTLFTGFVAIILSLYILFFFRFLPDKLPLFYSWPWGEKQLGTHQQFLIIPATVILVTLVNLIISKQLHPAQSFLKQALLLASLIITLILTVTFIKIVIVFI